MTTGVPRRSLRPLILIVSLAAAVVVAAGVVTIILLINRDDDPPPMTEPGNCMTNGGRSLVAVNFSGAAADDEMRKAADSLRANKMIEAQRTETRQQAFEHFKVTFKDQPELVKLARPEALPASVTVLPARHINSEDLATRLRTDFSAAEVRVYPCPPPT